MSDFGDRPVPPPPPSMPPPPPAPSPYAAGPAPSPYGAPPPPMAVPAYAGVPGMPPAKPERPQVTVGSVLMIAGAALLAIGAFLTWFTFKDGFTSVKVTGFTELGDEEEVRDGPAFVFLAVVIAGFGIAMLAARRVLAVAILGVIFAAFAVFATLADLGDVGDVKDLVEAFGGEFEWGPGLPLALIGSLVALGGSITALAKRRR